MSQKTVLKLKYWSLEDEFTGYTLAEKISRDLFIKLLKNGAIKCIVDDPSDPGYPIPFGNGYIRWIVIPSKLEELGIEYKIVKKIII